MKKKVSSQLSQVYMLLVGPLIDSDGSHQEEEEEEEVKVKGEEGGEGVSVPLTSTSPAAPHKNESEVRSNDSKWIYTHLLILFLVYRSRVHWCKRGYNICWINLL